MQDGKAQNQRLQRSRDATSSLLVSLLSGRIMEHDFSEYEIRCDPNNFVLKHEFVRDP